MRKGPQTLEHLPHPQAPPPPPASVRCSVGQAVIPVPDLRADIEEVGGGFERLSRRRTGMAFAIPVASSGGSWPDLLPDVRARILKLVEGGAP